MWVYKHIIVCSPIKASYYIGLCRRVVLCIQNIDESNGLEDIKVDILSNVLFPFFVLFPCIIFLHFYK